MMLDAKQQELGVGFRVSGLGSEVVPNHWMSDVDCRERRRELVSTPPSCQSGVGQGLTRCGLERLC